MNNKPVAWMDSVKELIPTELLPWFEENGYTHIPLYTHPKEHDLGIAEAIGFDKGYAAAQAKTLTEQDLDKLVKDAEESGCMDMYITGLIDGFNHARTILRKAQEK